MRMRTAVCAFCNEVIEPVDIQFGDVRIVNGEYWHLDCYAEYFDEVLEEA
ncbi:MAG TPA: hypothetical protein PKY35_10305 [Candidatus Hydrogenedentes bacterium]|nr:hypothetical protein [Candidatus Hydrogenedentota bacterium]HOL77412.1 hypothetical protein [Candidatus Hydrogenedentota bacterium]HPO84555.1 hypothetical protein [Candidatus Hydrogenedentota bacterium]